MRNNDPDSPSFTVANPQSLQRSRRIRGERLEAESEESSYNLTPLWHVFSYSFDQESRDLEQPTKCRQTKLLSIEERSDSLEDSRTKFLPSDFTFSIYQTPPSSPSPKKARPSPMPFPYFDPNSPTFAIATPPLSMEGPTSTATSSVSFST
jgi:hypothetical protein